VSERSITCDRPGRFGTPISIEIEPTLTHFLPLGATIRALQTTVNGFPFIEQRLSTAMNANAISIKK
jgi:hypothetical protein